MCGADGQERAGPAVPHASRQTTTQTPWLTGDMVRLDVLLFPEEMWVTICVGIFLVTNIT